jgi:Holliday junction resolvase RusA-like endonuclease
MIEIVFPFAPVAKGRPRMGRGRVYTPEKTRRFEQDVKLWASKQWRAKPLTGPVKVKVWFYLPKPKKPKCAHPISRPDLDNYLKALLDALNGVLWADDSQCDDIHAIKCYDDSEANAGLIELFCEEL